MRNFAVANGAYYVKTDDGTIFRVNNGQLISQDTADCLELEFSEIYRIQDKFTFFAQLFFSLIAVCGYAAMLFGGHIQ